MYRIDCISVTVQRYCACACTCARANSFKTITMVKNKRKNFGVYVSLLINQAWESGA